MNIKCLVFFLVFANLSAQVDFKESPNIFGDLKVYSTLPVAVSDINNDFLDDIAILDKGKTLQTFIQTSNQDQFESLYVGPVDISDQYALNIVDLNNDGIREILCAGFYDGVKVYSRFPGEEIYLQSSKTNADFFAQNLSFVDFNGDQFLDMFVCDDDSFSRVFRNAGGTSFMEIIDVFPFDPSAGELLSGNYSSIFTDFDDDGDIDLYISKCRSGVDSPEDFRRINQLYVNNGSGEFAEAASDYGLASGEQTWVTGFEDLDNDGDKDVVMVNHTGPNLILENQGDGQYIEVQEGTDFEEDFLGFQLLIQDFDNDGLLDIFIAGLESAMYWNRGDFIFEKEEGFLGGLEPTSAAFGDLNNDGFWDIYASYALGFGAASNLISDRIHLNQGNNNHFLKLSLVGTQSNYEAIGASISLFHNGLIQKREIKSGYSYGSSNSKSIVFGLGGNITYDSLVIDWPSGQRLVLEELEIDRHWIIKEDGCYDVQRQILVDDVPIVCENSSVRLIANEALSYVWSNGANSPEIEVANTGLYSLTYTLENNCSYETPSVKVFHIDDVAKPKIILNDPQKLYCSDDLVLLESDVQNDLSWSNGAGGYMIESEVDSYFFVDFNVCSGLRSDTLRLNIAEVPVPLIQNDTVLIGDTALLSAQGERISWYLSEDASQPISNEDDLIVVEVSNDTTFYVGNEVVFYEEDRVTLEEENVNFKYLPLDFNGGLTFSVNDYSVNLRRVTCYSDVEGMRKFQVRDRFGNIVDEREAKVGPQDSLVFLGFDLEPSDYYLLTTDADFNKVILGNNSPQLLAGELEEDPYPILSKTGNVTIRANRGSPFYFAYFFDWQIVEVDKSCSSERVPVSIIVDQDTDTKEIGLQKYKVKPNPFSEFIVISTESNKEENYKIISPNGSLLLKGKFINETKVSLSEFPAGFYLLQVTDGAQIFSKKLIKL